MRERLLLVVVIIGLVLIAIAAMIGGSFLVGLGPLGPVAINGGGTCSVGDTDVQFVLAGDKITLVLWCAGTQGPSESSSETGLFRSTAKGSFTAANGKPIVWTWQNPRERGGEFKIDGTRFDLANGSLFLLTTKDGKVGVTQLDVDLSQVRADAPGFDALAKKEPTIAKFVAEAAGQK